MSTRSEDQDIDVRDLLQSSGKVTSAAHDEAVMRNARDFAATRPSAPAESVSFATRHRSTPAQLPRHWWALAACVALAAIVALFGLWALGPRQEVMTARSLAGGVPHSESSRAVTQAASNARAMRPRLLSSALLLAGAIRGDETVAVIQLARDVATLRLQLDLSSAAEPPPYDLMLKSESGRTVWSGRSLGAGADISGVLSADIPTNLLPTDRYELALQSAATGTSHAAPIYYYFNVSRE